MGNLELAKYRVQETSSHVERTLWILFTIVCQEAKFLADARFVIEQSMNAKEEIMRMIKEREQKITEGLRDL